VRQFEGRVSPCALNQAAAASCESNRRSTSSSAVRRQWESRLPYFPTLVAYATESPGRRTGASFDLRQREEIVGVALSRSGSRRQEPSTNGGIANLWLAMRPASVAQMGRYVTRSFIIPARPVDWLTAFWLSCEARLADLSLRSL
jgi:hypothetical protein